MNKIYSWDNCKVCQKGEATNEHLDLHEPLDYLVTVRINGTCKADVLERLETLDEEGTFEGSIGVVSIKEVEQLC